MMHRARRLAPALAALLLAASACTALPEDGDVEVRTGVGRTASDTGFPYKPRPPQPGESPTEIVRHFLDAMTASPISTSVARQFLTPRASDAWQPDAAIITYADLGTPVGSTRVDVNLVGAHRIDAGGRWAGPVAEEDSELRFEMATEDGEWRIDDLPDAMVVPDNWFEDRYVQRNLHFFDPTGQVLVPEPVFVPRGGQTATTLVRGLLRGPGPGLHRVEQSFVPADLSLDVLVPEPVDGYAEVSLTGEVGAVDPTTSELLVAQFAWTLRQVPGLTRFRLTLNGTPLGSSSVASDIAVSRGEPYDPAVPEGWRDAFAVRNDELVNVAASGVSPVEGKSVPDMSGWEQFSVDLSAGRVAGVTGDGTRVEVVPLNGSLDAEEVVQGRELLKPAWDHGDTLWTIDRGDGVAKVWAVPGRRAREVRVPGITGEEVRDFLVSRDGSRLVAIVAGPEGDEVVSARIARDGASLRGRAFDVVWREPGEQLDLRALAWRTPTEVLVARRLGSRLTQVVHRSVDGSAATTGRDAATELVRDRVTDLVSSPVSSLPAWAVGRRRTFHPVASGPDRFVPPEGLRGLTYPG